MKKLELDKNTKELVGEVKKSKIISIKDFLEKYKVFFEIFSSIFLSVMSITITGIGIEINKRNAEISEKELMILMNDREPYFRIDSKEIINKSGDVPITQYIVTNEGGSISMANIRSVSTSIVIDLCSNRSGETVKSYRYAIPDAVELENEAFSAYNEEEKAFYFYGYDRENIERFAEELDKELKIHFADSDKVHVGMYIRDLLAIEYINYKNEHNFVVLAFSDGGMGKTQWNYEDIYLGSIEVGNYDIQLIVEEIEKDVKGSLELIG